MITKALTTMAVDGERNSRCGVTCDNDNHAADDDDDNKDTDEDNTNGDASCEATTPMMVTATQRRPQQRR